MAIKNPDAKQLSLIRVLTSSLITINPASEGGTNQEIINKNNSIYLNQTEDYIRKNLVDISTNTKNIGTMSDLKTIANINLVQALNELKDAIDMINGKGTSAYPIGTIMIAPSAPEVGGWQDLGEILEGQAIIGGKSTIGSTMNHNHNIEYNGAAENYSNKFLDDCEDRGEGNLSRGNTNNYGNYYEDIANKLKIISTGGEKNIVYGLGMELGLHLWKKISK